MVASPVVHKKLSIFNAVKQAMSVSTVQCYNNKKTLTAGTKFRNNTSSEQLSNLQFDLFGKLTQHDTQHLTKITSLIRSLHTYKH